MLSNTPQQCNKKPVKFVQGLDFLKVGRGESKTKKTTGRTKESEEKTIRSNFNSRGVNSRELFWFGGHSSESSGAFLTKIGRNLPTSLPDLSKPKFSRSNRRKIKILDPECFRTPKKLSRQFAVERKCSFSFSLIFFWNLCTPPFWAR